MNKYLIIGFTVFAVGAGFGWFINDNIMSVRIAKINEATSKTLKSIAVTAANKQRELQNEIDTQQRKWAAVEAEQYALLRDAEKQNDKLRADVDAGRKRLLVNASCPASSDRMPETGSSASVDNGAAPELNPEARQDYYSLRSGIERVTRQLLACQARLR